MRMQIAAAVRHIEALATRSGAAHETRMRNAVAVRKGEVLYAKAT
jgi:hypothetical protein